jgi:hypothetical protein
LGEIDGNARRNAPRREKPGNEPTSPNAPGDGFGAVESVEEPAVADPIVYDSDWEVSDETDSEPDDYLVIDGDIDDLDILAAPEEAVYAIPTDLTPLLPNPGLPHIPANEERFCLRAAIIIEYLKNWADEQDLRLYRGARFTDRPIAASALKYIQTSDTATLVHDLAYGVPSIAKSVLGKGDLTLRDLTDLPTLPTHFTSTCPPGIAHQSACTWGHRRWHPSTVVSGAESICITTKARRRLCSLK